MNFSHIFNYWDVIYEEFLRLKNQSHREIKLNIKTILNINQAFYQLITKPHLDKRDEMIRKSKVFFYAGLEHHYYTGLDDRQRALELSREMVGHDEKAFPNLHFRYKNYLLRTIHPDDPYLLEIGYRIGNCFCPNMHADNHGADNSLIRYTINSPYGGVIEITNLRGKIAMMTVIYRNGNTLAINSIETPRDKNDYFTINKDVLEMLKIYADRLVTTTIDSSEPIENVLVTDFGGFDPHYVLKEPVAPNDRFKYYDPNDEYLNMFTNLDAHQYYLKKYHHVKYGEVKQRYYFKPFRQRHFHDSFEEKEYQLLYKLYLLHNQYIIYANDYEKYKHENNQEQALVSYREMKNIKLKFLRDYETYLKEYHSNYDDFIMLMDIIRRVGIDKNINLNDIIIDEVYYSKDYYVIITKDQHLIINYLKTGLKKVKKVLTDLELLRDNSQINAEIDLFEEQLEDKKSHKEGVL